ALVAPETGAGVLDDGRWGARRRALVALVMGAGDRHGVLDDGRWGVRGWAPVTGDGDRHGRAR
ncbi:hypothetical protein CRG98_048908, partial [Punica granatum]